MARPFIFPPAPFLAMMVRIRYRFGAERGGRAWRNFQVGTSYAFAVKERC
jgi:hypothetical protein